MKSAVHLNTVVLVCRVLALGFITSSYSINHPNAVKERRKKNISNEICMPGYTGWVKQ